MSKQISAPSAERIPLHSMAAKPGLCVFTGIYALAVLGLSRSMLAGDGVGLVELSVVVLAGGLMIGRMWSLYQRVYMTREGLELTRPIRIVPWAQVGDAFRVPLTGTVASICCIGIRDLENWDLYFMGRADFDQVVGNGRPKRPKPHE
jgi:hypothetical protein